MRRILIVKLWALGDILMATPLLRALKAKWPDCEITWLADTHYAGMLDGNPLLDEVFPFDSGRWRRFWRYGQMGSYLQMSLALRRELNRRNFDAVLTLTGEKWWSVWFNAAPIRIGLFPRARPGLVGRLYTTAIARPRGDERHNTRHYLRAAEALGISGPFDERMVMGATPDEAPFVTNFRRTHSLADNLPLVILAPFSTGENRQWEPERHAQVSDWVGRTYGAQVVLTAAPKEAEAARHIAGLAQEKIVIAEGTSLRQYVGLIRAAALILCADSSAMHVAAAVGTPYVALFGPTPVAGRAPLVGRGFPLAMPLFCAPCDSSGCTNPVFRQCLKLIDAADVQQAVARLLPQPL